MGVRNTWRKWNQKDWPLSWFVNSSNMQPRMLLIRKRADTYGQACNERKKRPTTSGPEMFFFSNSTLVVWNGTGRCRRVSRSSLMRIRVVTAIDWETSVHSRGTCRPVQWSNNRERERERERKREREPSPLVLYLMSMVKTISETPDPILSRDLQW